ncbi:unnamed protein product, partial [Meganyctiphanes norvegica]
GFCNMNNVEAVEVVGETDVSIEYVSMDQWRTRVFDAAENSVRWLRSNNGFLTTAIFGLCWLIGVFLITCGLYMLSCEITRHQKFLNAQVHGGNEEEDDMEYEAVYSSWQIYTNLIGGTFIQFYIGIMFYVMYIRKKTLESNKAFLHNDLPPSYDDAVLHEEPPPTFSDLHLDFDDSLNFQDTSNLLSHQAPISMENTVPVHLNQNCRLQSGPLFSLHI